MTLPLDAAAPGGDGAEGGTEKISGQQIDTQNSSQPVKRSVQHVVRLPVPYDGETVVPVRPYIVSTTGWLHRLINDNDLTRIALCKGVHALTSRPRPPIVFADPERLGDYVLCATCEQLAAGQPRFEART